MPGWAGSSWYFLRFMDPLNNQEFVSKEKSEYWGQVDQGCMSTIEALVDRNDVIVYDSESHACMVDGVRLHQGKRKVFLHNDMKSFEKQMENTKI